MYQALIEGTTQLISFDQFKRRYGLAKVTSQEIELVCPSCKGKLYVQNYTSIVRRGSFNHYPGTTCIYVDNSSSCIAIPNEWNIENGKKIRELLEDKIFLSKLYCFCNKLCLKLPIDKFINLIKKADKRNLWSHSNMEEWLIGFLILLLDDFQNENSANKVYSFRFFLQKDLNNEVLSKRSQVRIEDLLTGDDYYLFKVFESGKLMNLPQGNPYPVTIENWTNFSKDYQWAYDKLGNILLKKIKELKKDGK